MKWCRREEEEEVDEEDIDEEKVVEKKQKVSEGCWRGGGGGVGLTL